MPGQRKRKQRRLREETARRSIVEGPGRWETLLSTEDHEEFRTFVHRMYAEGLATDPHLVRLDQFCGRLQHPNTYRVSVFVPAPA
ncbi:hypothetical protein [Streptomyces sp. NPDC006463]|uniref:hypothetical protein n=1 Tax=Streptomyces sp. NPDC006463 TaxID=3364746 RepID=UPI003686BADE